MPLHDWSDDGWWENFHSCWVFRLGEHLREVVPSGYRVYYGSYGRTGLRAAARPDVGVADDRPTDPTPVAGFQIEPDADVAVLPPAPQGYVYVQHRGATVAAVELVSPANKKAGDRSDTVQRYAGYLFGGIHLLMVDVLPRPAGVSLADLIAAEIALPGPSLPPPAAVAYQVTRSDADRRVNVWRRPLAVGRPLPTLPLPLASDLRVPVDLDVSYARAAADAYLT